MQKLGIAEFILVIEVHTDYNILARPQELLDVLQRSVFFGFFEQQQNYIPDAL